MTESPLEQAKQDFAQHITGDHILASVYEDLQKVRQVAGGNLMDPAIASTYQADLVEFNSTVMQYLPDFRLIGTLDGGHMLFSQAGVSDPVNVDCSKPMPVQPADLAQPKTNSQQDSTSTNPTDSTMFKLPDFTATNPTDSTALNPPYLTTTNPPDSGATNKPDSAATNQPDSSMFKLPDLTATNRPDSTATNRPDSTTISKPESTTIDQPVAATASDITKDSSGYATDIKYPPGADGKQSATHFAYDDSAGFHRLIAITKSDGSSYELITADGNPDKGKWKVTNASGKISIQDLNVQISQNGDWSRSENGKVITERAAGTTDGTMPEVPKTADPREVAAKQKIFDDATQKLGEGPWQSAERLLPGGSYADIKALTHLLKKYYQDHNDDATDRLVKLKVGNHWLTEDNLQEITDKSPALKKRLEDLKTS